MNNNAKTLVQALRGGEYEQAQGRLRRDDSFCCLGVACDIYQKETGNGHWEDRYPGSDYYEFVVDMDDDGVERQIYGLPTAVRQFFGFTDDGGEFADDSLVNLNDSGKSFSEIADTIESEPTGLFR